MQIRQLTPQLSVSPQIDAADLPALVAAGFRSVINNRPDGEGADQPPGDELAQAAQRQGLAYRHVPVVSGNYAPEAIEAMARALEALPPPVLAFCRSGTRSTTLWALQAARHEDADELIRIAASAGYDLGALRARLRAMHSS